MSYIDGPTPPGAQDMACNDDTQHLCRLAANGSEEAYTQLYHRYAPVLRIYLQRRLRPGASGDLQDLEQLVWCAIWTALPRFDGRCAVVTWMVAVAKHVAHASGRAQRRAALTLSRFIQSSPVGRQADQSDRLWDRLSLVDAMADLSPATRSVIELRYFGGLSDRDIARRLRVPVGTVKGRLRAGLIQLRHGLETRQFPGP